MADPCIHPSIKQPTIMMIDSFCVKGEAARQEIAAQSTEIPVDVCRETSANSNLIPSCFHCLRCPVE